ncbi:hypothetical protein GCM10022225_37020 [Plantactinospora mayteni]|uniref:Secreted protein n=1 Tax=Plantactinospora mayteni TaxID=566021 RepID=A0ABQ4F3Z0_9ACTN|nr:hypothetical protein [Plantactinospora mayteni]GIH01629.1 hypothetical protein Pma05_82010 [Plantactinospora mayteni]
MSVNLKRSAFVGVAVAAIAATGVVTATPAFAALSATTYAPGCGNSDGGGVGSFFAAGDEFWVSDWCADGHSVTIFVDVSPYQAGNGYDFYVRNAGGNGSTVIRDDDFPEGTRLNIRTCTTEGTSPVACSLWNDAQA